MKAKRIFSLILIVALVVVFSACGNTSAPEATAVEEETQEKESETLQDVQGDEGLEETTGELADDTDLDLDKDKTYKVGFCIAGLTNTIYNTLSQGMAKGCEELGFEYQCADAADDVTNHIANIENFITAGFDAIIIHAFDVEAFADVAQKAIDEGIVVVAYDDIIRDANGEKIDYPLTVAVDNAKFGNAIGNLAAAWVKETFAEDETVEFGVLNYPELEFIRVRSDAMEDVLTTECPNVKIVAYESAVYADDGVVVGENWNVAYPNLRGVIAINDNALTGYYQSWIAVGRDGNDPKFGMFGADAITDGVDLLAEGTILRGNAGIRIYAGGHDIIYEIAKELTGEKTKNIMFGIVELTTENVSEWIQDETVYFGDRTE